MGIKIEITDPSNTPAVELQAVIRMLQGFAVAPIADPRLPIACADLPDAGAPNLSPQQAFSPVGDVAAAAAFGGNASAAIPGASFQTPALPGNAAFTDPNVLPAAGMPADPAGAFGFNPNFNPPVMAGVSTQFPMLTAEQASAVSGGAPALPGPLLDSNGDKWDERIHAASRTTNKDGSYKLKPKVDKTLVAQVLAANKGAGSYPFPSTGQPQVSAPGSLPSIAPGAPSLPAANPTVPSLPAATIASPSSVSYVQLITAVQQRLVAGQLTAQEMVGICNQHGAADLPGLVAAPPAVLESVAKHMMALLAQKGFA